MDDANDVKNLIAATMDDMRAGSPPPEAQTVELPREVRRQMERAQEKAQKRGHSFTVLANGYAAKDTAGNLYAKQNGGIIRIVVTDDGQPMRLKKFDKARKKAAKRERARLRK